MAIGQEGIVVEELEIVDERLAPALILTSGLAKDVLGGTDESFPEGSCFLIALEYVATARHCGEMLRTNLNKQGVRAKGKIQPYGQRVFDPRLQLTWEVVDEIPLKHGDISILPVRPVAEDGEDCKPFLPWLSVFQDVNGLNHPILRMFQVEEGEELTFTGFTRVEFEYDRPKDDFDRLQQGVTGIGVIGKGPAKWQELETIDGMVKRLVLDNVAACGQNSGGPVMDSSGRLVGVVSASPDEGYSVVATFWQGADAPEGGGVQITKFELVDGEGAPTTIALRCDYGSPTKVNLSLSDQPSDLAITN